MQREAAWLRGEETGEDELRHRLAHDLGMPFVTLDSHTISQEALLLLPEAFCRVHDIVAYNLHGKVLEVASLDPLDVSAFDAFPSLAGYTIVPRLTDRASMKRALLQYQKILKETFGTDISRAVAARDARSLATALLSHARTQGASAIHLEERDGGLLVRYRIGAALHDGMTLSRSVVKDLFSHLKSLGRISSSLREGKFKFVCVGETFSVRVFAMPTASGEKITLHLSSVDDGTRGFTLESLGLQAGSEHIHHALSHKHGLIVVAGPEQSGKTTLLYTLFDMLHHPSRSLMSAEKHIEHFFPYAAQTQVDARGGVSFASGLRGILRQDPDIVLVSHVEDTDIASLALSAANSGKLVLAGVTAPSAGAGIDTLLSLGVSPDVLAATLRLAVGTRLVPLLCEQKAFYRIPKVIARDLESKADPIKIFAALKELGVVDPRSAWKDVSFFKAEACPNCQEGYVGHIGLHEILPASSTIRELIRSGASADALEHQAREEGMLSFTEDGLLKGAQGLVAIDDIVGL